MQESFWRRSACGVLSYFIKCIRSIKNMNKPFLILFLHSNDYPCCVKNVVILKGLRLLVFSKCAMACLEIAAKVECADG